jgi:hypothetical protein
MAAEGTSQTSCFAQNPSLITANSVFGFSPNDNLGLQILPHRLNGNHFLQWSQAVQLFLGGKKKTFQRGSILERAQTLMKGDWKANNDLVSSWL